MFNNPLGSEKNTLCSLGDNDREFEAAFSNEKDNKNTGKKFFYEECEAEKLLEVCKYDKNIPETEKAAII